MNAWFTFWMVAMSLSAMLFFGVALLVAIYGWRDLRDLYAQLHVNEDAEKPEPTGRQHP